MSRQTLVDEVDILGVQVDALTLDDAIRWITSRAGSNQPPAYVVKPYVEFFDKAYRNTEIQSLLNDADLAIADGIAVIWAAAWLYAGPRRWWRYVKTLVQIVLAPHDLYWPLPARTGGTTFAWPLLEAVAAAGLRVYLVGSPQAHSIEHTAATLQSSLPELKIAGSHDGRDPNRLPDRQSSTWLAALADDIRTAKADLILLGLGFPRQEFAAAYLREHLSHGVLIGEGGTFDYEQFGGKNRKAPATFQRLGLEWLWRLVIEPSRFKRQLAIPRFLYRVWHDRRR